MRHKKSRGPQKRLDFELTAENKISATKGDAALPEFAESEENERDSETLLPRPPQIFFYSGSPQFRKIQIQVLPVDPLCDRFIHPSRVNHIY